MRNLDEIFAALSCSAFRTKFKLRHRELNSMREKGLETIMREARELINRRIAPAEILNDGKQTPMRNHPVFVAQHATACCCRGCLAKWHGIPKGHRLTEAEMTHVLAVIRRWLESQLMSDPQGPAGSTASDESEGQNDSSTLGTGEKTLFD